MLRRGDEGAGAILIEAREKGRFSGLFERNSLGPKGAEWLKIGPQDAEMSGQISAYIERRVKADPDLWLIELDIADAAHFIVDSLPAG